MVNGASLCLAESCAFPHFPFSSKIFPGPFFHRGRTGRSGRMEISTISLATVKQTGHVVLAEVITQVSADLHECRSTGFPALCPSISLLFGPCTQGHFVERMQHSTSPSPLRLSSSQPHLGHKPAGAEELWTLQRPMGIEVSHKIFFFFIKKSKGNTFIR